MWALLPLKHFSGAKQRLSAVLTPAERSGLFLAMVQDVLSVLQSHPEIENTLIVSDDDDAKQLACHYGAQFLSESSLKVSGLNEAVQAGVRDLAEHGVDDVMVIHGDLPLICAAEISQLLAAHRRQVMQGATGSGGAVTIAPDERSEGTNCLVCTPASKMTYCYGSNSLALHANQARKVGMSLREIYMPGAACDIDTPQDLSELLRRANSQSAPHSYRYIAEHGLRLRLQQRQSLATQVIETESEATATLGMKYGWAG